LIRLALPKGRNLAPALEAFAAAGRPLAGLDGGDRRLRHAFPELGLEVLLLKDRDLLLYVERGAADCGVVGRDLLEELDGDLLVPCELAGGACRMSLIGPRGASLPAPGSLVRLATKYPRTATRLLATRAWSAEILELASSIELAPVLGLADLVLDLVESGATIAAHDLIELEVVREIAPCFVVQRAAWQVHRARMLELAAALERGGVRA